MFNDGDKVTVLDGTHIGCTGIIERKVAGVGGQQIWWVILNHKQTKHMYYEFEITKQEIL